MKRFIASLFNGKKKCCLCNEYVNINDLNCIDDWGIYSKNKIYYHKNCFMDILRHPTTYSNTQVDQAISIADHIKDKQWDSEVVIKKCDELLLEQELF